MFSILKPSFVYRDFSVEIADHDDDYDAEEWNYNGREVFRGSLDPNYKEWNVYWLYDENLIRIGLAEHDSENPEIFHALWFEDNPFGTLFQESNWKKKDVTLWSILSSEAYQDCLDDDFKTVFDKSLNSNIRLMTPDMILNLPTIYHCQKCNQKSLKPLNCSEVKLFDFLFYDFSILFLDDSFILYEAPNDSKVWSYLNIKRPCDVYEQDQQEQSSLPLIEQELMELPLQQVEIVKEQE